MSNIKFRIAAKTDVGLVRTNNEDNFQASSDLSAGRMRWVNNEICSLGDKGALIVVADGMGGMNAGEVASELAIETVREYFSPERLTSEVLKTRFSIERYMNDTIVAADARIKAEAKTRPDTKGMGTTIVIGWILDGKLYLSWCGDSRAYVYNPSAGLHQISKDHSYVQDLVDKGALTREEAFDFPDSNIITRCLSDGTTKAKPESLLKPYEICNDDVIMLCTDGLSGMIRDNEIESIMRNNEHNMDTLVDELIKAACEAEGSDNITICLCQILQGGKPCAPSEFVNYDKRINGTKGNFGRTLVNGQEETAAPKDKRLRYIALGCLLMAVVCAAIWWIYFRTNPGKDSVEKIKTEDVRSSEPKTEDAVKEPERESKPDEKQIKEPVNRENTKDRDEDKKRTGSIITGTKNTVQVKEPGAVDDDELTPITSPKNEAEDELTKVGSGKYTVEKGDTYFSLAKKFNTKVEILQQLNHNVELKAGATINVPKQ